MMLERKGKQYKADVHTPREIIELVCDIFDAGLRATRNPVVKSADEVCCVLRGCRPKVYRWLTIFYGAKAT